MTRVGEEEVWEGPWALEESDYEWNWPCRKLHILGPNQHAGNMGRKPDSLKTERKF